LPPFPNGGSIPSSLQKVAISLSILADSLSKLISWADKAARSISSSVSKLSTYLGILRFQLFSLIYSIVAKALYLSSALRALYV
jgi:hypothetical protein